MIAIYEVIQILMDIQIGFGLQWKIMTELDQLK